MKPVSWITIDRGDAVEFDDADVERGKHLIRMREEWEARMHTMADRVDQSKDQLAAGTLAELAFCYLANIHPVRLTEDQAFKFKFATDYDLAAITVQGIATFDIKQSERKDAQLIAARWQDKQPKDIYVLMIGAQRNFEFAGWCSGADLFREQNIRDLGHGYESYCLPQSQLNESLQLLAF